MREMKNSGVPWLKDIPSTWNVERGKNVLSLCKRPVREDDDVVTCFRDGEVILRSERRTDGFTMSDKEIGYQGINKGDIVIHGMDGFAGAMGVSKSTGKGSPVLIVCNPKYDAYPQYLIYYLRSLAMTDVFIALATGIRERSCDLRWNKVSELEFILPSATEQKAIADFLDKKCAEIDEMIALQEKIIDELKAYKQSVITEAVTKGLIPDVPMKCSGIEWIGEMPEHWQIGRMKNVCCQNGESLSEKENEDFEFDYVDIGSVSFEKGIFHTEHYAFKDAPSRARRRAKYGDFIMSTVRTYLRAIDVIDSEEKASYIYSTGFAVLTPNTNISYRFLSYISKSQPCLEQVMLFSRGINYPSINSTDLMCIRITYPSIAEQTIIAEYLDRKCSEIDSLITIKLSKIDSLKEYKKSIIYEYVTGKKETI
jgi:type I restriction enzyme S subunit